MSEPIEVFFAAWGTDDAKTRAQMIAGAVAADIQYDDPRTPSTLHGLDALVEYVGMFSANAPGWTAKVVKSDTVAGTTRVTVAFGGAGPDGKEMIQLGQYFVQKEADVISRMVGFVGTGE